MQNMRSLPKSSNCSNPYAAAKYDPVNLGRTYGSEQGCDVIFLVGEDHGVETWRLPAHKETLQAANPVFRAMFSDHFQTPSAPPPQTIDVPDCDGRALDNLLRFLYNEAVSVQSVEAALLTLYAAHKYQCPGLVQICVEYLSTNINHKNVLTILKHVRMLCGDYENLENLNIAKQMEKKEFTAGGNGSLKNSNSSSNNKSHSTRKLSVTSKDSDNLDSIEIQCATLLQKCLCYVDYEAIIILASDEMEDLNLEAIYLILSRDTLDIPDEKLVFNAILKWADKECKRKQLPLTPASKREVLSECLFLPRYLTMNRVFFEGEGCPANSGLFTSEEVTLLIGILSGDYSESTTSSIPNSPTHLYSRHLSVHTSSSLRPFIRTLQRPRHPIRPAAQSSPKKAKRGIRLLEKIKKCKTWCCFKSKPRSPNSNNSSQSPSPANSNQSSPTRQRNRTNRTQVSNKFNSAVEHIFICLACLFD